MIKLQNKSLDQVSYNQIIDDSPFEDFDVWLQKFIPLYHQQAEFNHKLSQRQRQTFCHTPTHSQVRDNRRVNPSGVNNTFPELAQGNYLITPIWNYNWRIHQIKLERQTQQICVYICSQHTSIHKYAFQRIQSIQKCLIQYAYTKVFNT